MKKALELATEASDRGEVPVGALVVADGQLVAESGNRVEEELSALAHAEMLVLQDAAKKLRNWRLNGCTLYVTLEPCAMCASAIRLSRVSRVVYGAHDVRLGGFGTFIDLSSQSVFGPTPEITSGVLAEESAALLKGFFQKRREDKS
ncbi:MAG: nucleoside deaminase [Bdellovibrionales bacterium]|nr:nucleoside deaminase [Bdellovibrionales bacterium]